VHFSFVMRKPRIKGVGLSVYHCVSRVVGRQFLLQQEEKDRFVSIMRALEAFHGVRVLSYCVMSNHFHILVEVPGREDVERLGDEEILGRVGQLYGRADEEELREKLEQAGETASKEAILARYRARMGEISHFIKELKQRFSSWYNRKHGRVGTLWEERFKSLLVERVEKVVLVVAAYIDLNPLRAGLVKNPGDYRWSAYGAAVAGAEAAQAGLGRVFGFSRRICGDGLGNDWKEAGALYRRWLEERCGGAFLRDDASQTFSGQGQSRPAQSGGIPLGWALRGECGYFLNGAAIGGVAFVDGLRASYRHHLGAGCLVGALPLEGMDGEELKDLRVFTRPRRNPFGVQRVFPQLARHPEGRRWKGMHGNSEVGEVRKSEGCADPASEDSFEGGDGARGRSAPLGETKRAAFLALREALGGKVVSGEEFLQATEVAAARKASQGNSVASQGAGAEGLPDGPAGWLEGLPPGRLTEILGGGAGGSGLLMALLLGGARWRRDYVVLLDLGGGFHPASFPAEDLESLLWVVCASAEEALEAGEVAARDGNFRHVLFDFRGAAPAGWRRMAASRWYRLLSALREREAIGTIFADLPVTSVSATRWRIELSPAEAEKGDSDRTKLGASAFLEVPELPRELLEKRLRIEVLKGRSPWDVSGFPWRDGWADVNRAEIRRRGRHRGETRTPSP